MTMTSEDITANMKESYRIAKCDPTISEGLGKFKSDTVKNLIEHFFYFGYVYGAEWAVKKVETELPNEFCTELRKLINEAREGKDE